MTVCVEARCLARKCSRNHPHIRIEGKYTKASATYCPGLVTALAKVFWQHIRALNGILCEEDRRRGLEDILSNEVLITADWKVLASWGWKGSAAALRAYEAEAIRGGDLR